MLLWPFLFWLMPNGTRAGCLMVLTGFLLILCLAFIFVTFAQLVPPAVPQAAPAVPAAVQPVATPEPAPTDGSAPALLRVRVPDDADLWLQGSRTKQDGALRLFQTPPLEPGKDFTYELRARWLRLQDKRIVDMTRSVKVRAGDRTYIDFNEPDSDAR